MSKAQKGSGETVNRHLSRRTFLRVGAASLGAAALGTMPRQGFAQASAVLKGTKLSILQGTYFIAPAQDLYKKRTFDIHAHVWTDRAFRQHLFWAKEWGCIPLKICLHGMTPYSAGLNEFAVILERGEGEIHGW